jgi:hypothetical protein
MPSAAALAALTLRLRASSAPLLPAWPIVAAPAALMPPLEVAEPSARRRILNRNSSSAEGRASGSGFRHRLISSRSEELQVQVQVQEEG